MNPSVVACDLAAVPLDDGTLDVAVFCLSLMGTNFTDYIREAHRCLRLDGSLHLWEPASYFDDVEVKKALAAEKSMRDYIKGKYAELVARMEDKKDLSGDDEKALKSAIEDWKKNGSY